MRHPLFVALREDKDSDEVEQEGTYFTKDMPDKSSTKVKIGKQTLTLTNLNKIFFPDEKYTKGDLIDYYREIAPVILPYLKDRPESLLRYPNGIKGINFYQKDSDLLKEDWIERTSIYSESNDKDIDYLLCQDEATLVYLINLGCIDLNPWSSRVESLENPDYLLIDLDPEKTDFENVITTALTTREVLEDLDIPSYPKTSGATGMHIYIPLNAKYTYEQARQLAELLCIHIHNKIPDITSMIRSPKERQGKVYLDFLQNRPGQTLASAYSVRAKPGATVSTPLEWSEVTKKLHPRQFTIKNAPKRLDKVGDLFKPVLGKGIDMEKIIKKLS
jgi:bifunctional non-homologous end joining protein LigD